MKRIAIAAMFHSFVISTAAASDLYVAVNLGPVLYGYSSQGSGATGGGYGNGTMTNDMKTGYGLLAGYDINERFAVEVEYDDLGGFEINSRSVKGSAVALAGVYSHRFNERFSLSGKLGIARSTLKATMKTGYISAYPLTATAVAEKVGFYGQYNINPEFGIRAGWDLYPVGDKESTRSFALLSYIGGVVRF